MTTKDKIAILKYVGFKNHTSGDIFKIHKFEKELKKFIGRPNFCITVIFNDSNNHFLISAKDTNSMSLTPEHNLFCGTINTEEFLIQILEAIYIIPIQE